MTEQEIQRDIGELRRVLDPRDVKYRRNFNRYGNAGVRRDDIRFPYGSPLGLWQRASDEDTTPTPVSLMAKSAIDTYVSKISQTKVRPFFTPINGEYATRKVSRQAQQAFDEIYTRQKVNLKGPLCMRDALIFDLGVAWVDGTTGGIHRVTPWEIYFDPAEIHYGTVTRCFLRQEYYPLAYLRDKIKGKGGLESKLRDYIGVKCTRIVYYDLAGKERVEFADGVEIARVKLASNTWPFAFLYYNQPLLGSRTTSMLDDLYPIQTTLDMLSQRIKDSAELTPANSIFLPQNGQIKASTISTRIGEIYTYTPSAGGGTPIVSTPRPIDPMYLQLLQYWEQVGYQSAGISQLSAQAKKPSGLNSGVALQTLEDVESERHNFVLQLYIRFLMDIASIYMEVVPEDSSVLPGKIGRANVTWAEVRKHRELYSIEFSATSSLSKDPKTKMEQIEKLIQMGLVDKDYVTSLLEMPDLEECYAVGTAVHDMCQRIVERAIETGETDFNEVVPLDQLYREALVTIMRLDASDEKQEVILRVVGLLREVKGAMEAVKASIAPPPAPPMPEPQGMPMQAPPHASAGLYVRGIEWDTWTSRPTSRRKLTG